MVVMWDGLLESLKDYVRVYSLAAWLDKTSVVMWEELKVLKMVV